MSGPPPGQPMFPGIPGMPMIPNTGGKPMVVVYMKGGGNPNLPFMMGGAPPPPQSGKKRKKKSKGGKKKKKSGEKKKKGEDESDSGSDRERVPDIPTAHTVKLPAGGTPGGGGAHNGNSKKGANGTNGAKGKNGGSQYGSNASCMSAPRTPNKNKPGTPVNPSSFGSGKGTDNNSKSITQTTQRSTISAVVAAPGGAHTAGGAAAGSKTQGKTPAKKHPVKKAPPKPGVKKEHFIIKDGNVDKSCVPMFTLIDGPGGCPIIVPIDARDECLTVNELGPQPLKVAPKEITKGYLVINEDGLLHFMPAKECKDPNAGTPGQLQKFLANSNIFIADSGPQLPDEKAFNSAKRTETKDKIGAEITVSGHITINEKGCCKFTRVSSPQPFPFYPANAAMGVLVKDLSNGYVYWVPTENRFVGPVLAHDVKPTCKEVTEAAIVGNIYKDAAGAAVWEVPSEKKENLMGYIMSSATGVPIYVSKPGDTIVRPVTPSKAKLKAAAAAAAAAAGAVTPTAISVTGQTASPSPASAAGSTTDATAADAAGTAPGTNNDGTASATVPVAGQPADGTTSTTPAASDPAAAAAAAGGEAEKKEAEGGQDASNNGNASQTESAPEAAAAAEQPKEEAKEEQEEAAPPPPPPPKQNDEHKKYKDERSSYL